MSEPSSGPVAGQRKNEAEDPSEMVVLANVAEALIADLPNHKAGRTARTVLAGSAMRAVVIALSEGAEMAEHESPAGATLFVIKGNITLRGVGQEWRVYAGQLVPIPPERHSVQAHADSAFLLTVALG